MPSLLDKLRGHDTRKVVIICDNAPCHSGLESTFARRENENYELLRLGPYSPALNPIGGIWSALKSVIKEKMRLTYSNMLNGYTGRLTSKTEWRMRYLEDIAVEARSVIRPDHCFQMVTHVKQRYMDVLQFRDL